MVEREAVEGGSESGSERLLARAGAVDVPTGAAVFAACDREFCAVALATSASTALAAGRGLPLAMLAGTGDVGRTNASSAEWPVDLLADGIADGTKIIELQLQLVTGGVGSVGSAIDHTIYVLDEDASGRTVHFVAGSSSVIENAGTKNLTVELSAADLLSPVEVDYRIHSG